MESARFDETLVESAATLPGKEEAVFQAKGEIERFPGWLAVYRTETEEQKAEEILDATGDEEAEESVGLPPLKVGMALTLEHLDTDQQFTKPPARFSEATLVKELEEDGIGRPVHLRQHHRHHPGPGLREEARGAVQAHGAGLRGHRPAGAGVP